jgi:putative membrane protein insertion efficiency factor
MKIISKILIGMIKVYKIVLSPYLTPSCRYLPTCSEYAVECLRAYGLVKGITKSSKRILSCHPLKILGGGEGYDPVVKELKAKK